MAMALGVAACGGGGGDNNPAQHLPDPPPAAEAQVFGLTGPEGLTFDGNGALYVGSTSGRITRITTGGFSCSWEPAEPGRARDRRRTRSSAAVHGQVLAISQDGVMRRDHRAHGERDRSDRFQRPLVSVLGLEGHPDRVSHADTTYQTLSRWVPSPNGMAFVPMAAARADTFRPRGSHEPERLWAS
jgi:hypothetical protein